jgi:hypothetical protein
MSQWRHNICEQCWSILHPAMAPIRRSYPARDDCCLCGKENTDSIFIHHDGDLLPCKGKCSVNAGLMGKTSPSVSQ